MKRIVLLIVILIIFSGCDNNNKKYAEKHDGIIVEMNSNKILVVSDTNLEDISNKTVDEIIDSARQKGSEYSNYGINPKESDELEIGTHVVVFWNGNQDDSDPPGRGADKIEIIMKQKE